VKYPCTECQKIVRSHQNALLCSECNTWSHMKCLNMSKSITKYCLQRSELDWTCLLCSLAK
jgi:hypothetical protein